MTARRALLLLVPIALVAGCAKRSAAPPTSVALDSEASQVTPYGDLPILRQKVAMGRVDVVYVDATTSERIFASARPATLAGVAVLVPRPEHLAAMKIHAMKNDPTRRFRELADIQLLAGLPGVDLDEIRSYFERAGLKEDWDELRAAL